jgi:2-polyprenyl-6-methoxyphenol hydroxylase-like FAD-dependent oxidoreductase
MLENKKILVIGAGIAGPTVCYYLKKFGFSPTLIESNDGLRKGGHAVDIRGIAVDIVKKMGIYKKICNMRTQLLHGCYVDAQGNTLVEEQGEKFCFRQDEEVEIVRDDLVEILMNAIKDIPCYFKKNIVQIEQHDENVKVTFSDNTTEIYDLVIGSDGLHSATRYMVFTKDEYSLIDFGSYFSVFSIPNYLKLNQSEMIFECNQKIVSIGSDKDSTMALASFMFRTHQKFNNIRSEEEQKNVLRRIFIDLGWEVNNLLQLMENSKDFYFDAVMQVKMRSWTKGRVALVGDSGYCPTPISGQGTVLALVGAYILAGELKAAEGNHVLAFERYNTLLCPFVEANQELGNWANETFLLPDNVSKDIIEKRSDTAWEKLKTISNAIKLPDYS